MGNSSAQVSAVAAIRAALIDWRNYLVGVFTQFLANPVIGRELRVRMRLGRSYRLQAFYLAFMVLIVVLAYEWVVGDAQRLSNPYRLQDALLGFYYTVMGTLISLIALIAPALTANAITLERERKTIDLLLATPLTARQLLVGKLVASFAFVVLLLALTMPITAVCVLLGGVSFGDLVRAYVIVAFSSLSLCSIALFTSVYARNSTLAVLWSYTRVAAFLGLTAILVLVQGAYRLSVASGLTGVPLMFPLALLNPFAAIAAADAELNLIHFRLPSWVVAVVLNLLLTRLILTAAARKVGLYDKDVLPSVRRQVLLIVPLAVFVSLVPLLTPGSVSSLGAAAFNTPEAGVLILFGMLPILALAAWISPFGQDDDKPCPNDGVFRLSKMFTPAPSGALPFLSALWVLTIGAVFAGFAWATPHTLPTLDPEFWLMLIGHITYFAGISVLFWGIGRYCSVLLGGRSLAGARALTIAVLVGIIVLPLLVHLLFFADAGNSPALQLWLLTPLLLRDTGVTWAVDVAQRLFTWGSVMLILGAILGALTRPRKASAA